MLVIKRIATIGTLALAITAAVGSTGCGDSLPTWDEIIVDHTKAAHARYIANDYACYEAYTAGMRLPLSPPRNIPERWTVLAPTLDSLGCPTMHTPAFPASLDSPSEH